jgi:FMN phosphatase YigB (HAD superfamily)
VAAGMVAIWIDDKQSKPFIPDNVRDTIIISSLAQMFGRKRRHY